MSDSDALREAIKLKQKALFLQSVLLQGLGLFGICTLIIIYIKKIKIYFVL